MEKRDFHLQGRVGEQSQELGLGRDLGRHQIQDRDTQRTDILMLRAVFIHDKDILALEGRTGRKSSGDFYRHGLWKDEGRGMKDEVLAHTFHPFPFIPHPF
jgi:hypothetical protein